MPLLQYCVFYKAFCCHAVNLVVIIKGVGVFVKGKINYEGIRIFSFQADAGFQIAPSAGEHSSILPGLKTHKYAAFIVGQGIVLFRVFRHVQGAEGQNQDFVQIQQFFPFYKVKEHQAYLARICGMADGKLKAQPVIGNLVKIPFFDSPWRSLDCFPVIYQCASSGIPRYGAAFFIQHRPSFQQFFFHIHPPFLSDFPDKPLTISCLAQLSPYLSLQPLPVHFSGCGKRYQRK